MPMSFLKVAVVAVCLLGMSPLAASASCMTCTYDPNYGLNFCELHGDPYNWDNCEGGERSVIISACDQCEETAANVMTMGHFASLEVRSPTAVEAIAAEYANIRLDDEQSALLYLNCEGAILAPKSVDSVTLGAAL